MVAWALQKQRTMKTRSFREGIPSVLLLGPLLVLLGCVADEDTGQNETSYPDSADSGGAPGPFLSLAEITNFQLEWSWTGDCGTGGHQTIDIDLAKRAVVSTYADEEGRFSLEEKDRKRILDVIALDAARKALADPLICSPGYFRDYSDAHVTLVGKQTVGKNIGGCNEGVYKTLNELAVHLRDAYDARDAPDSTTSTTVSGFRCGSSGAGH